MLADTQLRELGYRPLSVARHVEVKVAAELRRRHEQTGTPQHATIVQNNVPCPGAFGCPRVLPVMLPDGCSLTVYGPNYRCTFTGGASR